MKRTRRTVIASSAATNGKWKIFLWFNRMPASPEEYIPQLTTDRRPLLMWLSVAAVALALIGMIVGAPLAQATGHGFFALTVYGAFSHLCHQIPERSFFIAGHKFAVCARCTGLYVGFAGATLCYPLLRSLRRTDPPPRKWLFVAAVPLALDFSLTFFGIWENTHTSRCITGALLGAVSVFYVMPGLIELSRMNLRKMVGRETVTLP
jgi:uncharacterized membrane protein